MKMSTSQNEGEIKKKNGAVSFQNKSNKVGALYWCRDVLKRKVNRKEEEEEEEEDDKE
ncbi:conserved hypothetical protein [Ricinus communis]|uniref:Uncharacterized protein n=1 Tax=Ricinus communis TaxID=3988 RepID=B9RQZ3_RICCO|nr:conserved hypothetical protein [Ricinus communis]